MGKFDMKTEIVYKVVRNIAGKLYSNNIPPEPEYLKVGTSLRYISGRTRKPKIANSKLFAFSSLEEATAYGRFGYEVWCCEATGVTPGAVLGNSYHDCPARVRAVFARGSALLNFYPDRYFRHVVFCDTIKLLERV